MMKLFQRLLDFVFGLSVGLHISGVINENVLLMTILVTCVMWVAADLKRKQIN